MMKAAHVSLTAFLLLAPPSGSFAQDHDHGNDPRSPLSTCAVSSGMQLDWARQYMSGFSPEFDSPFAIAVDPSSGDVIVTGASWGSNQLPDMATIKYNGDGDTVWTRRYNGPGDSWDDGRALAIDLLGNVYVSGWTYSDEQFFNYITIKYTPSGAEEWVAQYNGGDDRAIDIALDASGNLYVTGTSGGPGTADDYATVKYNSLGEQQWVARYNGPGNTQDRAAELALDEQGNVYVTGSSGEGSENRSDYVTVKYNSSGVQQWVGRYTNYWDYATAIAIDASANVYVTGYSYAFGTYYDYVTVKYTTNGAQQWVRRFNGPGTSDDLAYDVAIDASGSVIVTGDAFFEPGNGSDYGTVKYSPSGVEQWVRSYNGPGSAVDIASALTIDESGNVYVTGGSRGSDLVDDFGTIKYSASGDELCVLRYGTEGETYYLATAITLDQSDGVYVTGYSSEVGQKLYTTVKYGLADFTGVEAPEPVRTLALASPNPVIVGGLVTVRGTGTTPVEMFAPDGRRIFRIDRDTQFRVATPGVFLVRAGGQTQKVVVIGK
jgi:Beta-propeller repeat